MKNSGFSTDSYRNHNVFLTFLFSFFQSLGRGIWMGNVLSAYIFFFTNESNTILGLTSAATGLAMTLVVFPSGYLADKYRRDIMLKLAGMIGLIGLILISLAVNIMLIFISLIFWGLFQGISRPALESILADSVPYGARSHVYARLHLVRQIAMATGPFLNVILFHVIKNEWDLPTLRKVMLVGILISMASIISMFFFSDNKSLGEESDAQLEKAIKNEDVVLGGLGHIEKSKAARLIPLILVASNVIIGFGAGMTIKFFPIFFIKIYSLNPISVQLIMGFTAVFTGIAAVIAQEFSIQKGRAELIFIVQAIATLCLFIIAFYPPIWVLVPIFIARGSLMNASQPLSRSILMDVIPKENRGKWNSVTAVAWGLFWNVSAAIGGYLIDGRIGSFVFGPSENFRLCFLVTAGLYSLGTGLILLLIPLVSREISTEKTVTPPVPINP